MSIKFEINSHSNIPVYKQLIQSVRYFISNGLYQAGDFLPSMNELSNELNISKETVKKAYTVLREKGIIESAHGKGFYILENNDTTRKKVLMLFDKLSTYKFVLYKSFIEHAGNNVGVTIHLHNQDADLFESLLDENLGDYDYYIVTPHFPLVPKVQSRIVKLLKKIPNRKLIILDRQMEKLAGNFGSVYQHFSDDVYLGLTEAAELLKKYKKLYILAMPGSLYSPVIKEGIQRFCTEQQLDCEFHHEINDTFIIKGGVYFVLNSQLDIELIEIIRNAKAKKLKIGKDIGILSYNEAPINEIILDGLTVLSTDFNEMGLLAAEMIRSGKLNKIRNKFGLVVRNTL